MSLEKRSVLYSLERVAPPVMLAGLLALQLVYLYIERVRAQLPLYSGVYTIVEGERGFLPNTQEMKRLAIQLGAAQGLRLDDQNVDVAVVLDVLRVTIRADAAHDWARFFAGYREGLRQAMLARCERARPAPTDACVPVSQPSFQGWSVSHRPWVKPLDLASLGVLALALAMWLLGQRPDGAP